MMPTRREARPGVEFDALHRAIDEWCLVVGDEHVITDEGLLQAAQAATFTTANKVHAIVRATKPGQVSKCLVIASRHGIAIHPVSQGKNWGLGSRVPTDDAVLLDLSRLNKIRDHDVRLGTVVVEPGVTFQKLYNFLQDQGGAWFLSGIGGSPHASVLANALERGDRLGPTGNGLDNACALEVALATGEIVHTGFSRFTDDPLKDVSGAGVGPSLDGIFAQSCYGVVTAITLWLLPRPTFLQKFIFKIPAIDKLDQVLNTLQLLIFEGTLQDNTVKIWNAYKVAAGIGTYPWTVTRRKTPFKMSEITGKEPLFGSTATYSPTETIAVATGDRIEAMLGPYVEWLERDLKSQTEPPLQDPFLGLPTEANLRSMYWRKKMAYPSVVDPDRDRCGIHWVCVAAPFAGEEFSETLSGIERCIFSFGFEPNVAIQCVSGRLLHLFILITYDRDIEGEDARALDCHNEILEYSQTCGYLPYRLGVQSMDAIPASRDDSVEVLQRLKNVFDPHRVLSRGHYDSFSSIK